MVISRHCCFIQSIVIIAIFQVSPTILAADLDEVKLHFFYGTNDDNQNKIFDLSVASSILQNQQYRAELPTVLYIHGFIQSIEANSVQTVKNAYLKNGGYNTLVLDWNILASELYPLAVAYMEMVGDRLADVLLELFSAGLSISDFHLVGHSLGAQMAGIIGSAVQEKSNKVIVLERITGLDPASPMFYEMFNILPDLYRPLNLNDARFVDIIHTDAGVFGQLPASGHIDFWPNSGKRLQPGCSIFDQSCSHSRAWMFWAESVEQSDDPSAFSAVQADDWEDFIVGHLDGSRVISMGINCPKDVAGNWFLQTNDENPLSFGQNGIQYENNENIFKRMFNVVVGYIIDKTS